MKICVCGKGGSGKSTVVTLLAKAARERGLPALVVDSDESNSGLFRMLGFKSPPVPLMELVGGKAALKKFFFSKIKHVIFPRFRQEINESESIEDIRKASVSSVFDFLENAFGGGHVFEYRLYEFRK
jgi:CO dehydrogenase nickel-insertion accessory protein CooC1